MEQFGTRSEILGALSHALDLVEGQPEGHAVRTGLIAVKVAQVMGLEEELVKDVWFTSLLKDSGCSNNSVRIAKLFGGDELVTKRKVKLIDWTSPIESIKFGIANTERGKGLGAKLRRIAANVGSPGEVMRQATLARCTRGAEIARLLKFSPRVAEGIYDLDEHWDGKGAAMGLEGGAIPIIARIVSLAQTMEVFVMSYGVNAGFLMLRERSGTWFDPEVVKACEGLRGQKKFWGCWEIEDGWDAYMPDFGEEIVGNEDIDRICQAFAMIIDAKSSFTSEHSVRVAQYSASILGYMGFCEEDQAGIKRAGLMHDIGKLGVSSGILEKPGKLDDDEFLAIKAHPRMSYEILRRVPGFGRISELASQHHERLDGQGYWQGLEGDDLCFETRVLTVADVWDALTANRPYRDAMPIEKAYEIMLKDEGSAFDGEVLAALGELELGQQRMAA